MATFTLTLGDETIAATLDDAAVVAAVGAVGATYGYQATILTPPRPGQPRALVPNPQTPTAFMLAHLVSHLNEVTKAHAVQVAVRQAQETPAPQIEVQP